MSIINVRRGFWRAIDFSPTRVIEFLWIGADDHVGIILPYGKAPGRPGGTVVVCHRKLRTGGGVFKAPTALPGLKIQVWVFPQRNGYSCVLCVLIRNSPGPTIVLDLRFQLSIRRKQV